MTCRRRATTALAWPLAVLLGLAGCAAPIIPQRSKPGGSARWADSVAQAKVLPWAPDAALCRVSGAGVGADGWLPDRGGTWTLTYWSATKQPMLQVTVDSDGVARAAEQKAGPEKGRSLPPAWQDSPKVWSIARSHSRAEPVHTFEAELAWGADTERAGDEPAWRIRFFLPDNSFETHVVRPDGRWVATY
jgi:hypothetical protein